MFTQKCLVLLKEGRPHVCGKKELLKFSVLSRQWTKWINYINSSIIRSDIKTWSIFCIHKLSTNFTFTKWLVISIRSASFFSSTPHSVQFTMTLQQQTSTEKAFTSQMTTLYFFSKPPLAPKMLSLSVLFKVE